MVALAMIASASRLAAAPQLDVTVNRTEIYLGESVLLTVKVSGTQQSSRPDVADTGDAAVQFLDSQQQHYEQIVSDGRGFRRVSFRGTMYTYQVTPNRVGDIRVGPVRVEADRQLLTAPGPVLNVKGIEEQDVVVLAVTPSRPTVLVDEPFEIALEILVRQPDPAKPDLTPLDASDPPHLSAAYLDGPALPGLDMPDVRGILGSLVISGGKAPGFAINQYSLRVDPFDMDSMFDFRGFAEQRKAAFALVQDPVQRDGKPYIRYRLGLTYNPRSEGNHTFGPVVFKGSVVTGLDGRGLRIKRRIFAVGPACTVRVVPPPAEGRPPTYIGAIGTNLNVSARLDVQTCNVGIR
jgi:hypothetical protein